MPKYSPERQSLTGSSCSWEHISFESDDASQDREFSLWSRRAQPDCSQVTRPGHGYNRLPPSRSPDRSPRRHRQRKPAGAPKPSGETYTDAMSSISPWKYSELLQDNLTMALVDMLHDDGCLLRERWGDIEAMLADMVATRIQSVPRGPHPSFDSSYEIHGHRVIRCADGFSKIFLEDCVAELSEAWHGLRITLVHASAIPCAAALAAGQDERTTLSSKNIDQMEKNSLGWMVPRGAKLSHIAIQEIQYRNVNKPKGQQKRFLLQDGSKSWRVLLGRGHKVRVVEHVPKMKEVEQTHEEQTDDEQADEEQTHEEQTEEVDQSYEEYIGTGAQKEIEKSHQMEEMNQIEEGVNEQQTEVNSFGWIVPRGAEFSDTAIKKIIEGDLTMRTRSRQKFLVHDGLKSWRVILCQGGRIRINKYTGNAAKRKEAEEVEESHQTEEMNQIEEGVNEQQTEVNSFGWIVPRGAEFSDTAIKKIIEGDLTMRTRPRQKFLVHDGLKSWRVILCQGGRIRINKYTGNAAKRKEAEEVEESHQTEEMNQIEEEVKEEQTEVNSLGWIVPRGAEFSDTAVKKIIEANLTGRTRPRRKLLIHDGLKSWRVTLLQGGRIRIGQYTGTAAKKEKPEEVEESPQAEEMNQIEEEVNKEQTEVNSFGWIVPRGAEFSDTAIKKIIEGDLTMRTRPRQKFLVHDGLKSWRVILCQGGRIRINKYTGTVPKKEEPGESHQIEELNELKKAQQIMEGKNKIPNT
ncbi:uncharacterized protein LOC108025426 isoform X2 [Drosophila biarmipes]|uniref:uncharacterized protein LOC108025426 isoform X2 n=1 Tax=Drosophila biarmipes TaxID=125945 RepID=UPI0021CC9E08|nr:uncharacterized protein LOC108025426 isoform X2 [Drosophila biarmipes]